MVIGVLRYMDTHMVLGSMPSPGLDKASIYDAFAYPVEGMTSARQMDVRLRR